MSKESNQNDNTGQEAIQRVKEDSEKDFETSINYIAAGALFLTMTFLEKMVNVKEAECKSLVIISWSLFTLSLLSNLISHQYASWLMDKSLEDIDKGYKERLKNWKRRAFKSRCWNISNVLILVVGIVFFIIFVAINFK